MYLSSFAPFVRAASARWNRWLRRSVRLYLALDEPQVNKQEVQNRLALVEWQLVRHLVDGDPLTAPLLEEVQSIVAMAQAELLGSEGEIRQLRAELSAERALHPWLRAA